MPVQDAIRWLKRQRSVTNRAETSIESVTRALEQVYEDLGGSQGMGINNPLTGSFLIPVGDTGQYAQIGSTGYRDLAGYLPTKPGVARNRARLCMSGWVQRNELDFEFSFPADGSPAPLADMNVPGGFNIGACEAFRSSDYTTASMLLSGGGGVLSVWRPAWLSEEQLTGWRITMNFTTVSLGGGNQPYAPLIGTAITPPLGGPVAKELRGESKWPNPVGLIDDRADDWDVVVAQMVKDGELPRDYFKNNPWTSREYVPSDKPPLKWPTLPTLPNLPSKPKPPEPEPEPPELPATKPKPGPGKP